MKELSGHFKEETILFLSVVKWVLLASVIGVIVGLATGFFLILLEGSAQFVSSFPSYFLLLPFALLASALIIKHLAPQAEGHGTEKVIEAIHKRAGMIPFSVVPVKLVATIITLAFGGSAGKEGPCAQIGAGIASTFSRLLSFNAVDRKKLVICGISAGFASVFGTPMAGAIFGIEVLYVGSIFYSALLPSFIAGMISFHVTKAFGINYMYGSTGFVSSFSSTFFAEVVAAGIFFGLCSFLLIKILQAAEALRKRIAPGPLTSALAAGCSLILIAHFISGSVLGLGLDTIERTLSGSSVPWYLFLLKMVTTSITLSFGGSGGIITPIFFVGSTAGAMFAGLFNLDIAIFASIGLVAVLAGATNAPIAASIMAVELLGPAIAPYASIACIISYLITGHRSVYPSQMLDTPKSSSLEVDRGELAEDLEVRLVESKQKAWDETIMKINPVNKKK